MVAILDYSNCSRISSIQSTKYVRSSEKKTSSVDAGYMCLAAWLWRHILNTEIIYSFHIQYYLLYLRCNSDTNNDVNFS